MISQTHKNQFLKTNKAMNKKCVWQILLILILISFNGKVFSQTYQVNGNAVNYPNGLVRLTSSTPPGPGVWQSSSAWNTTKHDLTQPFEMTFDMFFGCLSADADGGDGITFTFQNQGINALGGGGGFLGVGGITPAVSIEFDTWNAGAGVNDIAQDHIAININGEVDHLTQKPTFQGTSGIVEVQPVFGNRDLESCAVNANDYYTITVVWDPSNKQLKLYEGTELTLTYTDDLVARFGGLDVNGKCEVYWGFTSATGSASNEQWIAPAGSLIPWECTSGSCCAFFEPEITSPSTTICNNPITLGVNAVYNSYEWSTGAKTSTAEITTPGTYKVTVLQDQSGVLCPGEKSIIIAPTGPTATLLSGGGITCPDDPLSLNVSLTGTAPWTLTYSVDNITQPEVTINTSPYNINGSPTHTYSLVSVKDNGNCNGIVSGGPASVTTYEGIPVGHDTVFVAPGKALLKVDDDGGTYEWYENSLGGASLFTGVEFETPELTGTKTYYVQNTEIPAEINKNVAFADRNAHGPNGNNTQTATGLSHLDLKLNFTAHTSFILNSVNVDVNVTSSPQPPAAKVTVYLVNSTTGVSTPPIDLPISGLAMGVHSVLVPLNAYPVISGNNYQIRYEATGGGVGGIMYWDFIIARHLHTGLPSSIVGDELTITAPGQGHYPGIFSWNIEVPSPAYDCGRTPVTAYLCPSGSFTGATKICDNGTDTTPIGVTLTGTSPWTINYEIDGVPQTPKVVTGLPFSFTSLTGAHDYTLTGVSNYLGDGCMHNYGTISIGVKPLPPVGYNKTFVGPASVVLTVDQNTGATYKWYDAAVGGTLVNTGATFTTPVLNDTTTYYVEQVIDGFTSCSRTAVIAYEMGELLIPNLVTANSDNMNDKFEIQGLPNESQLQVFNRWGKKIFHDLNYKNTWGDGEIAPGVYFYDLLLPDGKTYKGWVNVVK
jgi:hypothetical protein